MIVDVVPGLNMSYDADPAHVVMAGEELADLFINHYLCEVWFSFMLPPPRTSVACNVNVVKYIYSIISQRSMSRCCTKSSFFLSIFFFLYFFFSSFFVTLFYMFFFFVAFFCSV